MHKRHLHHWLTRLRKISFWLFIIIMAISAATAAIGLRQNNIGALKLRDKVLKVDKQNGDVEKALKELRTYTYSHMNSNLSSDTGIYPPIQLKYTYERLVEKERRRVEQANGDIYQRAQDYCERIEPESYYGAGRLDCITAYIDENSSSGVKPRKIQESLYKFDFVSPVWSPDLAGWSIVVFIFVLILLIIKLFAQWWIKYQLQR